MKTRCPCCGAENSLDALLAHDEARDAMLALMQAGGETARLAVQYVALFRPKQTALTWGRMAKLLNELLPDMQRGVIERDRVAYPAPPEAWAYGFREMLAKRHAGSLKLPLKSHGYLYEVMCGWRGQGLVTTAAPASDVQNSQTLNAVAILQGMKK